MLGGDGRVGGGEGGGGEGSGEGGKASGSEGASIQRFRDASSSVRSPRSPAPAACRYPLTLGCAARNAAMSSRLALSHATSSSPAPNSCSCAKSPCPSRATRPLRDESSTRLAPRVTSSEAGRPHEGRARPDLR